MGYEESQSSTAQVWQGYVGQGQTKECKTERRGSLTAPTTACCDLQPFASRRRKGQMHRCQQR